MKANKFIWLALAILLGVGMGAAGAATNEVSALLQQGLFEEEANQNLDAAIQAYQAVIAQTEKNRQFAATAIFRLGECYRKQGKTNEAGAQYQRILREFADQTQLATLSQENLAGMGVTVPGASAPTAMSDAALQTQKQLLEEEIKVVDQQLQSQQARVKQGLLGPDEVLQTQRQLLELKRQLAALESGQAQISSGAGQQAAPVVTDEEDQELQRIQTMIQNSPDLINGPNGPLGRAANVGQLRVATYLLDHGANVNGPPGGDPPLVMAAQNDQKTMVELLLSRGADVNARNTSGATALIEATRSGYASVVEVLLAHKADVNEPYTKQNNEETPLHLAAARGYTNLVNMLLANGADVNAFNTFGETPLNTAAGTGNTDVMELLIARKAKVDARDNNGDTPLLTATRRDQVSAAALLLKNGANVNVTENGTSFNGWMPLHFAVDHNQIELLKLLLENHAGPDARISSYYSSARMNYFADVTPLMMAVMNGETEAAKLLVEYKADVNARDKDGDTPLTLTVARNARPAGGPRPAGFMGQPVGFGSQAQVPLKSQLEIAELLLANGADVNAQNNASESPLSLAVAENSPDMVKLLLAHKPNVEILDRNDWTPLQAAVNQQQVDITGLLLDAGANPNLKFVGGGFNGFTPLGVAVSQQNKDMVEALLAGHADPNAPDDMHETPLSRAKEIKGGANNPQQLQTIAAIIDLLLKAGANENLHRLSIISVSRDGDVRAVFSRQTDVPNHFTLLDLVTQFYAPPYHGHVNIGSMSPLELNQLPGFVFPDFARVTISRMKKDGNTNVIRIDLESAFQSGDCSKNIPLEWGDIVEIPEADHNVNETWPGLQDAARATLRKCLAAQVAIMVKGRTNLVTLKPLIYRRYAGNFGLRGIFATTDETHFTYTIPNEDPRQQSNFWLREVVYGANVILTSSDLSRVKVTRKDAATRKTMEMTFDLQNQDPANQLWLCDGDVIEIPEKP